MKKKSKNPFKKIGSYIGILIAVILTIFPLLLCGSPNTSFYNQDCLNSYDNFRDIPFSWIYNPPQSGIYDFSYITVIAGNFILWFFIGYLIQRFIFKK